jgi:opine dehydrogenase
MATENITVLGGGGVGLATAVHLTKKGFQVTLFELPEFSDSISPFLKNKEVSFAGVLGKGTIKIDNITTDVKEALHGKKILLLATPATGHQKFMETCIPFLEDGQIIVVETGYFAAMRFYGSIQKTGKNIIMAEMNLAPYTSSREGGNSLFIHSCREDRTIAAMPATKTAEVIKSLKNIYPDLSAAKNVLQTSLDNANWIMHAPFALPFRGLFEREGNYVLPIKEAVIPSSLKLTTEMENEKELLGKAFGIDLPKFEHIFEGGGDWVEAMAKSPEFETWKLKYKNGFNTFMSEDLYFALPVVSQLADLSKVSVPLVKSFLCIFSIIDGIDYLKEGLKLKDIGLKGQDVDGIIRFVEEGTLK